MFEQLLKFIGKPLNDPALQAFMAEYGYKQPKRTEIFGRSSDRSFWVEHRKLGVNLLFDIEADDNDFYKLSVIIYFIMTLEGHASIVPWLGAWYFRISDGYIYDIQK